MANTSDGTPEASVALDTGRKLEIRNGEVAMLGQLVLTILSVPHNGVRKVLGLESGYI